MGLFRKTPRQKKPEGQWILTLAVAVAFIVLITSILDVRTALDNINAENPQWGSVIKESIDGESIATQIFSIFLSGAIAYFVWAVIIGLPGRWDRQKFITYLLLAGAVYVIWAYGIPALTELPSLFETAAVIQYNVAPQTLIPIP